ncbi:type II secretion system F family protein [Roseicitreum antarcticum]
MLNFATENALALVAVAGVLGLALIVVAFVMMTRQRRDPMEKFQQTVRNKGRDPEKNMRRRGSQADNKLDKYARFLEPANEAELSDARRIMVQAGYHGKNAVRDFHALQFILGIGGIFLGLVYTLLLSDRAAQTPLTMAAFTLTPGLLGYYFPKYWVNKRRTARQEEITQGFPDALDMLLICVEAGQSLDQSIRRVGSEIKASYPALGEEFETISQEVRAGKERAAVLKDFGDRCGLPDINSFVTVVVQSASFGTSIGDALRVYAAEMRDKRVMLAEEKANVLPTKLTLGTMMFTVPPLLIILIGPSVYGIVTLLDSANFGG